MSLWSHRCRSQYYGENNLKGCEEVVEYGFNGIEVDVQYHNGIFYMHHDRWDLSNNQTLQQLLNLNLSVDLWIDMKTSSIESVDRLISMVSNFSNRLLVEVYDEKMIGPLKDANITVTSTNFNTDFRSVLGIQYLLIGTDKSLHGSWYLDILCLNDAYFADGGDVVVTDFYKPSSCKTYLPILFWRIFLWGLIFLILLSVIFCCQRRNRSGYKKI